MSRARGQIFTVDAVIAVMLFISILLTFYWLDSYTTEKIALEREDSLVLGISHQVADLLVTERLVSSRSLLDNERVSRFFSQEYNQTLRESGAGGADIRVMIYDNEGLLLYAHGAAPSGHTFLHSAERVAVLDGKPVRVRVEAWR